MKIHETNIFLFLFPLIFACNNVNNTNKSIAIEELNFPLVIDTLINKKMVTKSEYWLNNDKHPLYYIGKLKDTILVDRTIIMSAHPPPPKDVDNYNAWLIENNSIYKNYLLNPSDENRNLNLSDSVILSIKIDTSQLINNRGYKSYPILITNNSNGSVIIGYGNDIAVITEAKDTNDIWRPIEQKHIHFCGVGLEYIILPENEVVVTSEVIYEGNYSTTLRLKIEDNYSNEFKGKININQFENEWSENGYKRSKPTY